MVDHEKPQSRPAFHFHQNCGKRADSPRFRTDQRRSAAPRSVPQTFTPNLRASVPRTLRRSPHVSPESQQRRNGRELHRDQRVDGRSKYHITTRADQAEPPAPRPAPTLRAAPEDAAAPGAARHGRAAGAALHAGAAAVRPVRLVSEVPAVRGGVRAADRHDGARADSERAEHAPGAARG